MYIRTDITTTLRMKHSPDDAAVVAMEMDNLNVVAVVQTVHVLYFKAMHTTILDYK